MKLLLLTSVVIIGLSQGSPLLDNVETEWIKFKEQYGKQYRSLVEGTERKAIFSSTYKMISQHNELYAQGQTTYFLAINERADLTMEEMNKLNGFKSTSTPIENVVFKPKEGAAVPETYDWRDKNAVTEVKNQGHCGSCWAFSTTGSIESQYFLKTGKLVSLSEQNLVDCSRNDDNAGCQGGDMIPAFKYVHSNDGIDSESSYPYVGRQRTCQYSAANNVTSIKGYGIVAEGKEDDLKAAIATIGPISVAIDASKLDFNFYAGGIYYNSKCKYKNDDLDHAVLAVGYGSDNGHDYFLVKNSWGPSWGIKGYVKMSRNRDNNCGIATAGCYPILY